MILLQSPPSDIRSSRRNHPVTNLPLPTSSSSNPHAYRRFCIDPSLSFLHSRTLARSLALSPPPYERRTPQDSKGSRPSSCFGCPPLLLYFFPARPAPAFTRINPSCTFLATNLPNHKGSTHSHISLVPDNCNILDMTYFFRIPLI